MIAASGDRNQVHALGRVVEQGFELDMDALAERVMMAVTGGEELSRLLRALGLDPPLLDTGDEDARVEGSWHRRGFELAGSCGHFVPGMRIILCNYFTLKRTRMEQSGNTPLPRLHAAAGTRYDESSLSQVIFVRSRPWRRDHIGKAI
jgi:hypothetical protein